MTKNSYRCVYKDYGTLKILEKIYFDDYDYVKKQWQRKNSI